MSRGQGGGVGGDLRGLADLLGLGQLVDLGFVEDAPSLLGDGRGGRGRRRGGVRHSRFPFSDFTTTSTMKWGAVKVPPTAAKVTLAVVSATLTAYTTALAADSVTLVTFAHPLAVDRTALAVGGMALVADSFALAEFTTGSPRRGRNNSRSVAVSSQSDAKISQSDSKNSQSETVSSQSGDKIGRSEAVQCLAHDRPEH